MSAKRVSIFEVAKAAGVSHQTVSRVVNHSPNVSDATRAKVQAAIDRLGYRPSGTARALATRRTRTIALIVGGISYFGPLSTIASVEAMARRHRLYVSISIMNEYEYTRQAFEGVAGACLDQGVEAFVFVAPTDAMVSAALQARLDVPRVVLTSTHGATDVESLLQGDGIGCLGIDQWGATARIIDYLSGLGHRRALYLAGPSEWRDAATRHAAWTAQAPAAGMESDVVALSDWSATSAYREAGEYLDRFGLTPEVAAGGRGRVERALAGASGLPTVIVCANDQQAFGVRRALYERGLDVPRDLSLVGFDDMPVADNAIPPLTTARPDFSRLGVAAMRTLFSLSGADGSASAPDLPVAHGVGLIDAPLVVRDSTAAPRA